MMMMETTGIQFKEIIKTIGKQKGYEINLKGKGILDYDINGSVRIQMKGLNMFLIPIFYRSLTNSPYISINVFKIPIFFLR